MITKNTSNAVSMDSRRFLGALNDSAQSRVAFFEERVQQMGLQAGKTWRLAALHAKQLFIEDVNTHNYLIAEHARESHGKVTITNIRPIEIVEGEKQSLFSESCTRLVSALAANNQREMSVAFDKMKAHRFSGRAIPASGVVRCKDNVTRNISITSPTMVGEDVRDQLVAVIVESLRDKVIVENGSVVAGYFDDGEKFRLPVTKWGGRKLIARRMRDAASNAYWSEGFQARITEVARLISENKIEEAVSMISPFLDEMEEFTMLTSGQVKTLVENTLATQGVFNQQLCDDTATLFHRTNMRVNKAKIVKEWHNIAKAAEHPVLSENVHRLAESKNFDAAMDKFLSLIFEAISNREVAAGALATTLESLRDKTPKIRESHDLSGKLNGLISRLQQQDFDDAAIYEAEDLIATIQEELSATDTLGNFDQMPGTDSGMGAGAGGVADSGLDVEPSEGSGAPVININSPLIQIGGSSSAAEEGADDLGGLDDDLGGIGEDDPMGGEGEEDLDALLGGGAAAAPPAAPPAPAQQAGQQPLMQGKERKGKPLAESRPNHFEMKTEDDDDMPDDDCELEESSDPYAFRRVGKVAAESLRAFDYGAPVLTDEGDIYRVVQIMHRLATEHKLKGKGLALNLESMAKAGINALGLRIPAGKMPKALEQVITSFHESKLPFPGAAAPFGKKGKQDDESEDSEDCDDDCDEGVAEDQHRGPWMKRRGFAKTSYKNQQHEGRARVQQAINEGIQWAARGQDDAILGEMAGVRFIFDHGTSEDVEPIILSEDGQVEIPIPEDIRESAYASANMVEGDDREFVTWLAESIEQLRPIGDGEDQALSEAIAKITTGPDGSLSVEVTPDVAVGEVEEGGMGEEDGMPGMGDEEMGDEMGMGDEEMGDEVPEDGMAPVDSIETGGEEGPPEMGGDSEAMPDFEGPDGGEGPVGGGEEPDSGSVADLAGAATRQMAPPARGGGHEDEHGMFEDEDVTVPTSAKYTKHVKDDRREIPASKMPGKAGNKLADIGPELKVDDGSGTNPPTAKKGSDQ